jgi:hypothetical protein
MRNKKPNMPATVTAAAVTINEVSAAAHLAMQQGELYRIIGRIETAHFLETVSSRVIGEAYLAARTVIGGLGSIAVRTTEGTVRNVSSLEDFCDAVMPVSHRRCQQIAQAMHTLGPALYEQAEKLGLGHRNYAAIRALPNNMQDEVKAAIESGDRDQVLVLIEELAARNAALNAVAKEAEKTLAAKDKVIATKDAKLNELAEADALRRNGSPNEREAEQQARLREAGLSAELALQQLIVAADEVMNSPATATIELQARQALEFISQRLADLCAERSIAIDVLGEAVVPGWKREIGELATSRRNETSAKSSGSKS